MVELDRRQALTTMAAAGAGLLAGGVPMLIRAQHPGHRRSLRSASATTHPSPRPPVDPGYAHGPVRPLHSPVHSLHDLVPAAPPTAVALTIDDGPHPEYTPQMLELLAEFQVPATFSLISEQVTQLPRLVQRIVAAGHEVADHTVTHPLNLPNLGASSIEHEIGGAHDQIAQTAGIAPKCFRSPGGNWSTQVIDVAAQHGMVCIDWAVDPRDWSRPGTSHITDTLMQAKPGDILLCHDGGGDRSETLQSLRTVIPALKQRGLTFVAL
jgi:peptidoglycan/xylan/chitin deacetylase (PgdA/CDA1 family)